MLHFAMKMKSTKATCYGNKTSLVARSSLEPGLSAGYPAASGRCPLTIASLQPNLSSVFQANILHRQNYLEAKVGQQLIISFLAC